MLRVGLTGGMGSGKSLVLRRFREKGWTALSADAIVGELLNEDEGIITQVCKHFGDTVMDAKGGINRGALAERVFKDEKELDWLEQLLHPGVLEELKKTMEDKARGPFVAEIPLLFEKNLENLFDFTVCIEAELNLRLQRLSGKGISPEEAMPRITRQLPPGIKMERADFVISNDGSLNFLYEQVDRLLDKLERHSLKSGPRL